MACKKRMNIPVLSILILICTSLILIGCSSLGFSKEAKPFALYDLNDNTISLADYHGEIVFLNFWASWCEPCDQEMPDLEKIYQEYKDQGLVFLTINSGEEKDIVVEYMDSKGYTFPVLLDSKLEVSREYKTSSIPVSFFINKEGKIASKKVGLITEEELRKGIEALKK